MRVATDAFIGRRSELVRIDECLTAGDRLLLISGPPGIGKSRLAEEYRRQHGSDWPGGIWRCDVSDVAEPRALWPRLTRALAIGLERRDSPGDLRGPCVDRLNAQGRCLLVFDGFDGLVAGADPLVPMLLADTPSTHLVITSRQRLGLRGERVLLLGPLSSVPGEGGAFSEGVALFAARLDGAGAPPCSERDLALVAEIVGLVEGIPLAIELAAARAARVGVREVLGRLRDAQAGADRAPPLPALTAAIASSIDALPADERRALAACSLFRGTFTAGAAEAVVPAGLDGTSPIELVERLIDRSLIRGIATSASQEVPALVLYESIRAFARGEDVDPAVRARYASHVTAEARAWATQLTEDAAGEAKAGLLSSMSDLLHLAAGHDEAALSAALALDPLLRSCGPPSLHVEILDHAIDVVEPGLGAPSARAALLAARGEALRRRGENARAGTDLEGAVRLAEALGDRRVQGAALATLAIIAHQAAELGEAEALARRALDLHLQAGDGRSERISRITIGLVLLDNERLDEAQAEMLGTLAASHRAGDTWAEAMVLITLGLVAVERGQLDEARVRLQRAAELSRDVGDHRSRALALGDLAMLDHLEGSLTSARAGYEEALALLASAAGYRFEGLFLGGLAAVLADLGETEAAILARDRAAAIARRLDDRVLQAALRLNEGHLALARAARLGDAAPLGVLESLASNARATAAIRSARRVLQTAIDRARPRADEQVPTLTLGEGALRFRVGDGPWVSLARRRALVPLLQSLVDAHARGASGRSIEDLLAAGWPGERFSAESGVNRARMAVATLRKLGLKPVLLTVADGYSLDPRLEIRRR